MPRFILFCLLSLAPALAESNSSFTLSFETPAVSLRAGGSANAVLNLAVVSGFTQPIYLIASSLPNGVTVAIPSPLVGTQTARLKISAAASVNPQTLSVTIYASGGGENGSVNVSITVLPPGLVSASEVPSASRWAGSWGASAVTPSNESGAYYLTNVTVRQVAHLSIGTTTAVRLKLSNALGKQQVSFGAVHVAQWAGKSAIIPETDRVVTFCGAATVSLPPGEEVLSDPVSLPLPAGADVAVSLYIPKSSNVPATMHTFGNQTAYFSLGDATGHATLPAAVTDTVRPYLTGIEVEASGASAVVTLGDSLTDGMLSSLDQNLRWPDDLARRLANKVGVVNAGIAGNCVLIDCLGPDGLARFKRDVLQVAGVRYLIILEGVNDIGNAPDLAPAQLIEAYRQMVALAHAQKILVFGATIPPFGGSQYATVAHESLRRQVNAFIRTGGVFDGVIDFDKALADPANPSALLPAFDGDHIRPNDAGYQAMANAIDLTLFSSSN